MRLVQNLGQVNTTDEGVELKPGTHDCVVEDNLIHTAGTMFSNPAIGHGIEVNERDLGNQSWTGNPNQLIRNNTIHSSGTAIRMGTGSTAYNNVIYNITAGERGIFVNNDNSDSFTRTIYHNTIDLSTTNSVFIDAGTTDVKNNIGPTTANNIATADAYYVDKAGADYHLVSGSAPVNAGLDLTATVPTDIEGNSRTANPPPDLGAYEIVSGTRPDPPANLRIIIR